MRITLYKETSFTAVKYLGEQTRSSQSVKAMRKCTGSFVCLSLRLLPSARRVPGLVKRCPAESGEEGSRSQPASPRGESSRTARFRYRHRAREPRRERRSAGPRTQPRGCGPGWLGGAGLPVGPARSWRRVPPRQPSGGLARAAAAADRGPAASSSDRRSPAAPALPGPVGAARLTAGPLPCPALSRPGSVLKRAPGAAAARGDSGEAPGLGWAGRAGARAA